MSRQPVKTQVLVDGDPIVYRIGYATQSRSINCVVEHATGELDALRFDSKTARNAWLRAHEGSTVVSEEEEVTPEPESHAYHGVKRLLVEIADESGSDDLHIILDRKSTRLNSS